MNIGDTVWFVSDEDRTIIKGEVVGPPCSKGFLSVRHRFGSTSGSRVDCYLSWEGARKALLREAEREVLRVKELQDPEGIVWPGGEGSCVGTFQGIDVVLRDDGECHYFLDIVNGGSLCLGFSAGLLGAKRAANEVLTSIYDTLVNSKEAE